MFVNLLSESMKNDISVKRVSAFSKRLLQVALQQPPQYACGCLFILSEVLKARPPLWNIMLQNESVDDDIEHFEDIIENAQSVTETNASIKLENSVGTVSMENGSNSVLNNNSLASDSEDEEDLPASSSEDDDSSGGEDNLLQQDLNDREKLETVSALKTESQTPDNGSSLTGIYNPKQREPLYCNADRTSWWELIVLASHVHPSVAKMAQTLLSGANIVYNGNPINDLSLGAFLDKFMEKKPKANRRAEGTWHGGSKIAPSRKLEMRNQLIGAEILSLAEEDVPPEDLIFHKFYMNKTSSSKKTKKKKKQAEDAIAEDLVNVSVNDESDNEEIDKILGSVKLVSENEGDYDYDDLGHVVNEDDDEELLGNDSDVDMDSPTDENFQDAISGGGGVDGVSDVDSADDLEELVGKGKKGKKRKVGGSSTVSPFASLEDYAHLLNDERSEEIKPESGKKKKKKRKSD